MALDLPNGVSFRKNDAVQIMHNETLLSGTVLISCEGYMSPYEDLCYLMSAPHKDVEDLFAEETEIKSAYVLAAITSKTIPFSFLPIEVELRALKNNANYCKMNALAVICGKPDKDEYLVFLETMGKKKP
jgi:hypothetical protein